MPKYKLSKEDEAIMELSANTVKAIRNKIKPLFENKLVIKEVYTGDQGVINEEIAIDAIVWHKILGPIGYNKKVRIFTFYRPVVSINKRVICTIHVEEILRIVKKEMAAYNNIISWEDITYVQKFETEAQGCLNKNL